MHEQDTSLKSPEPSGQYDHILVQYPQLKELRVCLTRLPVPVKKYEKPKPKSKKPRALIRPMIAESSLEMPIGSDMDPSVSSTAKSKEEMDSPVQCKKFKPDLSPSKAEATSSSTDPLFCDTLMKPGSDSGDKLLESPAFTYSPESIEDPLKCSDDLCVSTNEDVYVKSDDNEFNSSLKLKDMNYGISFIETESSMVVSEKSPRTPEESKSDDIDKVTSDLMDFRSSSKLKDLGISFETTEICIKSDDMNKLCNALNSNTEFSVKIDSELPRNVDESESDKIVEVKDSSPESESSLSKDLRMIQEELDKDFGSQTNTDPPVDNTLNSVENLVSYINEVQVPLKPIQTESQWPVEEATEKPAVEVAEVPQQSYSFMPVMQGNQMYLLATPTGVQQYLPQQQQQPMYPQYVYPQQMVQYVTQVSAEGEEVQQYPQVIQTIQNPYQQNLIQYSTSQNSIIQYQTPNQIQYQQVPAQNLIQYYNNNQQLIQYSQQPTVQQPTVQYCNQPTPPPTPKTPAITTKISQNVSKLAKQTTRTQVVVQTGQNVNRSPKTQQPQQNVVQFISQLPEYLQKNVQSTNVTQNPNQLIQNPNQLIQNMILQQQQQQLMLMQAANQDVQNPNPNVVQFTSQSPQIAAQASPIPTQVTQNPVMQPQNPVIQQQMTQNAAMQPQIHQNVMQVPIQLLQNMAQFQHAATSNVTQTQLPQGMQQSQILQHLLQGQMPQNMAQTQIPQNMAQIQVPQTQIPQNMMQSQMPQNMVQTQISQNMAQNQISQNIAQNQISQNMVQSQVPQNVTQTQISQNQIPQNMVQSQIPQTQNMAQSQLPQNMAQSQIPQNMAQSVQLLQNVAQIQNSSPNVSQIPQNQNMTQVPVQLLQNMAHIPTQMTPNPTSMPQMVQNQPQTSTPPSTNPMPVLQYQPLNSQSEPLTDQNGSNPATLSAGPNGTYYVMSQGRVVGCLKKI